MRVKPAMTQSLAVSVDRPAAEQLQVVRGQQAAEVQTQLVVALPMSLVEELVAGALLNSYASGNTRVARPLSDLTGCVG